MIEEFIKEKINEIFELAKQQAKEELAMEQMPLNQKALMKKFGFDHAYIKKLERRGLKYRKQGKNTMYDLKDVYEVLELEKECFKNV